MPPIVFHCTLSDPQLAEQLESADDPRYNFFQSAGEKGTVSFDPTRTFFGIGFDPDYAPSFRRFADTLERFGRKNPAGSPPLYDASIVSENRLLQAPLEYLVPLSAERIAALEAFDRPGRDFIQPTGRSVQIDGEEFPLARIAFNPFGALFDRKLAEDIKGFITDARKYYRALLEETGTAPDDLPSDLRNLVAFFNYPQTHQEIPLSQERIALLLPFDPAQEFFSPTGREEEGYPVVRLTIDFYRLEAEKDYRERFGGFASAVIDLYSELLLEGNRTLAELPPDLANMINLVASARMVDPKIPLGEGIRLSYFPIPKARLLTCSMSNLSEACVDELFGDRNVLTFGSYLRFVSKRTGHDPSVGFLNESIRWVGDQLEVDFVDTIDLELRNDGGEKTGELTFFVRAERRRGSRMLTLSINCFEEGDIAGIWEGRMDKPGELPEFRLTTPETAAVLEKHNLEPEDLLQFVIGRVGENLSETNEAEYEYNLGLLYNSHGLLREHNEAKALHRRSWRRRGAVHYRHLLRGR